MTKLMVGNLNTDGAPITAEGARMLAAAVIYNAVVDVLKRKPKRHSNELAINYRCRVNEWEMHRNEAYRFLTGNSAMSTFWFHVAGLPTLKGTMDSVIEKLSNNLVWARETGVHHG